MEMAGMQEQVGLAAGAAAGTTLGQVQMEWQAVRLGVMVAKQQMALLEASAVLEMAEMVPMEAALLVLGPALG